VKALERRLAKLEAAAPPAEPLILERWIIDSAEARFDCQWLHSRVVEGRPETMEKFEPFEHVKPWSRADIARTERVQR